MDWENRLYTVKCVLIQVGRLRHIIDIFTLKMITLTLPHSMPIFHPTAHCTEQHTDEKAIFKIQFLIHASLVGGIIGKGIVLALSSCVIFISL